MANSPATILTSARLLLQYLPAVLAVALVGYAIIAGGYFVTIVGFALIYAVFVTGLNIFMGYAGQASFGHNAFAAIGGYTSAVLTATYAWPPIPALIFGVCGAVACAIVVGYPTLRLKGHYLAMATLAIGLIVYEIAVQWQSVTQGYTGISGIPPLGIGTASDRAQLLMLSIIIALCMWSAWLIRNSRFGRALVALSGSEDAARALGVDVARYKLAAFVVSAVYASLAGSLIVHIVGVCQSRDVRTAHGDPRLHHALRRRHRHDHGPIVGAIVINLLPEIFRGLKDYQDLVYGAALILLLIYVPGGLASLGFSLARTPTKVAPAFKPEGVKT